MPGIYRGGQASLAVAAAAAVIGAAIAAGALAPESATAAGSAPTVQAGQQALPPAMLVRTPGGVGPGLVSDEHDGRGSQRALGADRVNLEVQLTSDPAPPPAGSPAAGPASRVLPAALPAMTWASTVIRPGAAP